MVKVTYIYHSAFLVETDSANLLFDYQMGTVPPFEYDKPLYVFASHRHKDHFSPLVFSLTKRTAKIIYIMSSDIKGVLPDVVGEEMNFLDPDETFKDELIKVETLPSTDEGVAFIIEIDGKTIYHAGDLNDWTWKEADQTTNDWMRRNYREQILRMQNRKIDVAFVVMDPRQAEEYAAGMEWFLDHVDAPAVFPMHCWDNYRMIKRYIKRTDVPSYKERIQYIKKLNQVFLLP